MPRLIALILALTIGLGLASVQPAEAAHHHRHRPVPVCASYHNLRTGTHALTDNQAGSHSTLFVAMRKLVCSAAKGATVDIKTWFAENTRNPGTVTTLLRDIRLMHRYHHVHFRLLLGLSAWTRGGANGYYGYRQTVHDFRAVGVRVYTCRTACATTATLGSEHGKWFYVNHLSRRAGGGTAVLSDSSNLSIEQIDGQRQTGMLIVRNRPLSAAFASTYAHYLQCALRRACVKYAVGAAPTVHWSGQGSTYAYFTPTNSDPAAYALKHTECTGRKLIVVASLTVSRNAVVRQLARLKAEGCTVRVLAEHSSPAAVSLHGRCLTNHDKTMIIDASSRFVLSGAEDFVHWALHGSDNQMVRTTDSAAVSTYERFYSHLWSLGTACR